MELESRSKKETNRRPLDGLAEFKPPTMTKTTMQGSRKQFSSFILFLTVVIIANLCPFDSQQPLFHDQDAPEQPEVADIAKTAATTTTTKAASRLNSADHLNSFATSGLWSYLEQFDNCIKFIKLMFTNPIRLNRRVTRFSQAEARMIGKMAKMWYIKKKIKKLSKKLKKHTIAVPVFTAIPIYEHSYYPQPHVTHYTHHGGLHHAAAASTTAYSPAIAAPLATSQSQTLSTQTGAGAAAGQHMAASASSQHHQLAPYSPPAHHHSHHSAYHHPMQTSGSHQIINAYAPSPPLYVDETGGLYGHYGNAYGRYDGGYQVW